MLQSFSDIGLLYIHHKQSISLAEFSVYIFGNLPTELRCGVSSDRVDFGAFTFFGGGGGCYLGCLGISDSEALWLWDCWWPDVVRGLLAGRFGTDLIT